MENTIVYIPNNYTDAGKVLGMFEVRNTVEAFVLCVPLTVLTVLLSPFGLTGTLITVLVLVITVGGFALVGVYDHSLIAFARLYRRWRKNRRILIYRGSSRICQKKKSVCGNGN